MKQKGFIALISTLIISVVLLFIVVSFSEKSIAGRFLLLELERKIDSEQLAHACLQVAVIAIFNNPSYSVDPSTRVKVDVGDDAVCHIMSVDSSGTIVTKGVSGKATTYYEAQWSSVAEDIVSFKELPTFP